jgi:hypothetical protein
MRKEQGGHAKSSQYEITPLVVVVGALNSFMPPVPPLGVHKLI